MTRPYVPLKERQVACLRCQGFFRPVRSDRRYCSIRCGHKPARLVAMPSIEVRRERAARAIRARALWRKRNIYRLYVGQRCIWCQDFFLYSKLCKTPRIACSLDCLRQAQAGGLFWTEDDYRDFFSS